MRCAPPTVHRPLPGWTVCFLTGAGISLAAPLPVPLPVAALLLAAAAAAAWIAPPAGRRALVLIAIVGAGWFRGETAAAPRDAPRLAGIMDRPAETFSVRGRIISDPEFTPGEAGSELAGTWRFSLAIHSVHRTRRPEPAAGELHGRWETADRARRPRYGDEWEFGGVIRDRGGASRLRYGQSRWTLDIHDDRAALLAVNQGRPVIAAFLAGREACADLLIRGLESYPRQAAVLKALMLGYRSELPDDVEQLFRFTGTLHVFAVSGLHVGIFSLLLTVLFRSLGIASNRWVLLLIPLIAFYTVATGMKPSTVRAAVMAVAYWSAALLHRKPDAPSALALAALLIVAWRPAELIAPGFILSFAVVAGLLALYPMLSRPLLRRLQPDPWRAAPLPRWRRWGLWAGRYAASLLALSIACWIVSLPLIAAYFNIVTPIALVSNLFVVPGSLLLVFTGCLSLLAGAGWGGLAEVFNHANRVFVDGLLGVVSAFAELPGGYRYVESPGWLTLAAWYGLILGWRWLPGRRYRAVAAAALAALLAGWLWILPVRSDLRVTALDARGGVTVHIDAAARGHVLFDPGPRTAPVLRYLRQSGVTTLDALVLSRCDRATAGGAPGLFEAVRIRRVALCSHRGDRELLARIAGEAERQDAAMLLLQPDDVFRLPGMSAWSVIGVQPTPNGREACLFQVGRGGFRAALMTRTGPELEYGLSIDVEAPRAEALIVSDRSIAGPLYPGWLDRVAPDVVVISRKPVRTAGDDYAAVVDGLGADRRSVVFTELTGGVRLVSPAGRREPGYRLEVLPPP